MIKVPWVDLRLQNSKIIVRNIKEKEQGNNTLSSNKKIKWNNPANMKSEGNLSQEIVRDQL